MSGREGVIDLIEMQLAAMRYQLDTAASLLMTLRDPVVAEPDPAPAPGDVASPAAETTRPERPKVFGGKGRADDESREASGDAPIIPPPGANGILGDTRSV